MADGIIDPGAVYSQRYNINMNEQVPLSLLINKLITGNAKVEMTPTQTNVGDRESPVYETTMTPTIGGLPAVKNADGTYSVQVGDRTHGGYATVPVSVNPQTGVAQLTKPDAITYSPGRDVSFGGFLKEAALPIAAVVAAAYLGPEVLSAFGAEGATVAGTAGTAGMGATGAAELAAGGATSGALEAYGAGAAGTALGANALAPTTTGTVAPAVTGGAAAPATLASGLPAAGTTIPAAAGATAPVSGALGTGLYDAGLGNIADAGITGSAFTPASVVNAPLAAVPVAATGALGAGMGGAATDATGAIIGTGTAAEGAAALAEGGLNLPPGTMTALSTLGQILGAGTQVKGQGAQADILTQAAKDAVAAEQAVLQPRITAGQQGVSALQTGLAPGGQYATPFTMEQALVSPAMKTALEQGQEAVQTGAAAKGGLLTSNTLADLTKYGQKVGAQYEQEAFNQWLQNRQQQLNAQAALANIGAQPTQTLANISGTAPLVAGAVNAQATGAKYDLAGNLISDISKGIQTASTLSDLLGKGKDWLSNLSG